MRTKNTLTTWRERMNTGGLDSFANASYGPDEWFCDWCPVVGRSRDSSILEESNFDTAVSMLGGESDTVCIIQFNHWAVGWIEELMIDPKDANAVRIACDIHENLETYPVLDEDDYSRREFEVAVEAWVSYGASDYRRALLRYWDIDSLDDTQLATDIKLALDDVSNDVLYEIFADEDGYYESDSEGVYFVGIDETSADMEDVLPQLVSDIKRERFERAVDKFAPETRWYWDNTVPFKL